MKHLNVKSEFRRDLKKLLRSDKSLKNFNLFCPSCESQSILITTKRNIAEVKCSFCSITEKIKTFIHYELIDVYGDFLDLFHIDTEIQKSENYILEIKKEANDDLKKDQYEDLVLHYSKILEICRKKVASLELLLDDEYIKKEQADKWVLNLNKYISLEKEAEAILQRIIKTYEDTKSDNGNKTQKKTEVNDIFSDPNFLDF